MEIREIEDDLSAEWDSYVASNAAATCFHWYGWRGALSSVLGYDTHFLGAFEGNKLVGILPIAFVKSLLFGKSMSSLPFCSYGGAVANSLEAQNALIEYAIELSKQADVKYFELRKRSPGLDSAPRQDLYVTFRKELPEVLDERMLNIPSKRRNMVRKAQKQGLSTEVSRDLDSFFELYACNARAHGTPALPKSFFAALLKDLGEKTDILFVKDDKGKPISCIMNFYVHGEIHAGFAGEDPDARFSSANDLKYWGLMLHAVHRGCDLFDFGRSKIGTGSYQFKKLWGFESSALCYEYPYLPEGKVPQNNPNNAKYSLAISIWKRMPFWVVNRLGPRIIHGLG